MQSVQGRSCVQAESRRGPARMSQEAPRPCAGFGWCNQRPVDLQRGLWCERLQPCQARLTTEWGLEGLSAVVVVRVVVSDRVLAWWAGEVGGRPGAGTCRCAIAGQVLREKYGPFVAVVQPRAACRRPRASSLDSRCAQAHCRAWPWPGSLERPCATDPGRMAALLPPLTYRFSRLQPSCTPDQSCLQK